MVVKNENLIGDMNICFHVSVFPNSSGEISSPAVRVNWFTELPYHKHHTKASLSIATEELGQDWQEFIKFEIVLNSYRKSSQIWKLCSSNKYPLKVLLVIHIVYSLTRTSNSEHKKARKKYWLENLDWPPAACLKGTLYLQWEIPCIHSCSH